MGILMTVGIIASILTAGGTGYLVYKEGRRSLEKVDRIIKEVDNKPEDPKKPEDAIKEILDKVNGDSVNARWILKVEQKEEDKKDYEKEFQDSIEEAREAGVPEEKILKTTEEVDAFFGYSDKKMHEMIDEIRDMDLDKTEEKPVLTTEEKPEVDWNEVTFNVMEKEFDHRYNPYPVQAARSSLFGKALADGLITQETYDKAKEHFGKLWDYVGD